MSNITIASKAGFCFGVSRAVEMALGSENACTLGELIHNKDVTDELAAKGIGRIDDISQADGRTVIIRSHGVGADVYRALENNNIAYKDGTCPFVKRIQDIAAKCAENGVQVVIVGDRDHPEVQGIAGHGKDVVLGTWILAIG